MFEILKRQILSALATLRQCIDNCPDNEWNETHGDAPFSQVLFHVLVYTDLYLLESGEDFKNQRFHLENKRFFKDYYDIISGLIRHIQHHAAQLGLRIQQIIGKELKWIGTIEN